MYRLSSIFFILILLCASNPDLRGQQARSAPSAAADRQKREPLNVLFIVVDDLRCDLGVYGHDEAKTPHIDRLASEGVTFMRAYCQQAVCTPSRASVLTGRRPDETGVLNLYTHFRKKLPEVETLPEFFKHRGYETTSFGKIFHGQDSHQDPQSWSQPATLYRNDISEGYFLPHNQASKSAANRPATGKKMSATEAAEVDDARYPDGRIARNAAQWLKRRGEEDADKPFFLAVGFHKPHLPFSAPARYWKMYDRDQLSPADPSQSPDDQLDLALAASLPELRGYRDIPNQGKIPSAKAAELRHGYLACVSFVDAQIGLLLESLEESGQADSTLIVFWGDHGYHLGERGYWCKSTNYEQDTRVPLIIKTPQVGRRGVKSSALVELVDLYPTVVDLAKLEMPSNLSGASLRPILEDPSRPHKQAAFSQFPRPWEIADWRKPPQRIMGYAVRTDRWRLVLWVDLARGKELAAELYDQQTDPDELRNLAGSSDFLQVEKLHRKLLRNQFQLAQQDE